MKEIDSPILVIILLVLVFVSRNSLAHFLAFLVRMRVFLEIVGTFFLFINIYELDCPSASGDVDANKQNQLTREQLRYSGERRRT